VSAEHNVMQTNSVTVCQTEDLPCPIHYHTLIKEYTKVEEISYTISVEVCFCGYYCFLSV